MLIFSLRVGKVTISFYQARTTDWSRIIHFTCSSKVIGVTTTPTAACSTKSLITVTVYRKITMENYSQLICSHRWPPPSSSVERSSWRRLSVSSLWLRLTYLDCNRTQTERERECSTTYEKQKLYSLSKQTVPLHFIKCWLCHMYILQWWYNQPHYLS